MADPDGYDRLEARGEKLAGDLADHPTRLAVKATAFVVFLVLLIGAVSWGVGWLGTGRDIVGPANVKEQYRAVIEDWQSMQAAAANACAAKTGKATGGAPALVEDPAFAYEATYRRIAVDYNRRQANIFEAKIAGPGGYPQQAPQLAVMQRRVC